MIPTWGWRPFHSTALERSGHPSFSESFGSRVSPRRSSRGCGEFAWASDDEDIAATEEPTAKEGLPWLRATEEEPAVPAKRGTGADRRLYVDPALLVTSFGRHEEFRGGRYTC